MQPSAKLPQRARQFATKRGRVKPRVGRIANEFVKGRDVGDRMTDQVAVSDERAPRFGADSCASNRLNSSRGNDPGGTRFARGLSASKRVPHGFPPAGHLEVLEEDDARRKVKSEDRSVRARFDRRHAIQKRVLSRDRFRALSTADRGKAALVEILDDLLIPTPRDVADPHRRRRASTTVNCRSGLRLVSGGCAIHPMVFRRPRNRSTPSRRHSIEARVLIGTLGLVHLA